MRATEADASRDEAERRVQRPFEDHERWVTDRMKPNAEPCFEAVAALVRAG